MSDASAKSEVAAERGSKKDERASWTIYDVFFWRDAPDWYRKTFLSAGFGLCYCTLKQYLNRHELEVFMPPRSKILPQTMQEGYRNSQMLKYGFLKVGSEVTTIAGAAATYYAGAYYLGRYRGNVHTWENFAASGSVAGLGVALWLLRPFKTRPAAFGMVLGGILGGAGAAVQQSFGEPFWDESHDFEGWFLGKVINLKEPLQAAASSESSPAVCATESVNATTGLSSPGSLMASSTAVVVAGLASSTVSTNTPDKHNGSLPFRNGHAHAPDMLSDAKQHNEAAVASVVPPRSWWRLWP